MDDNNTTNNVMGADSDSGGEAIIICIDHTTHKPEYLKAQLDAIRIYATHKIQSHPRTVIGLLNMSHGAFYDRFKVLPTRDLDRLFGRFTSMVRGYSFDIIDTLFCAFTMLMYDAPKGLQKRIVIFAGGIIAIYVGGTAESLRERGVTIDIVNFTLGDVLDSRKERLEAFVAAVNTDGKTHIVHVDEGSSLSNLLSSFMPGDAHVEANGMKLIHSNKAIENETSSVTVKEMKNKNELIHLKKTTHLSRRRKKATENENVSSKGAAGDEHADANQTLIHSKKAIENETSSVTVKGMKNKNELIHLKKTKSCLSSQKNGNENENVSSKGAVVGDEYVKNAPFKLHNGSKPYRYPGLGWLMQICLFVGLIAALVMCVE